MDVFLFILSSVLLLCSFVMAFVVYQLLKAVYLFLKPVLEKRGETTFLFRLSPKVVSVLLVLCFLAMVI